MSEITRLLAGRSVQNITTNGISLVVRCSDGFEVQIGFADPDTGKPVKVSPVVVGAGFPQALPRHPQIALGSAADLRKALERARG